MKIHEHLDVAYHTAPQVQFGLSRLGVKLYLKLGAENIRDDSKKGTVYGSSISQSFCFTASKNQSLAASSKKSRRK